MVDMTRMQKASFIVLSDTHDYQFRDNASSKLQLLVPKVDVLLHCGDLTHVGGIPVFKKALKMLRNFDTELKLVIAGNHNLELDEGWYKAHPEEDEDYLDDHARAMEVMKGQLAKEAGVTYLEEGTHTFNLQSGATFKIYASPYQPEFVDYAFPCERNKDRFNVSGETAEGAISIAENPIPAGVHIVMTHGPPKGFRVENLGCENTLRAVQRVKPLMHCFGHIHEGYGANKIVWEDDEKKAEDDMVNEYPQAMNLHIESGKETLMINAAILDDEHQPTNAPWIINLDLPSS
ncbi:putative ser thr protein phosphatase family protein [Botrytis fragariae]|uniref:Putative ser thr protein phosphatase family protein n=1 Tax=Botrytis fragariae TaxID=1964551 RepID=A0A8H6AW70_9HELO|nr:putative ser thr protein phosphatase family protein [Botrytis fragariae]KAF5874678.1 putative ser thr protein phosphatase family protein [Botrytis fragariae]